MLEVATIIHSYLRKHPNSQINTQQCDAVKEKMQTNLEPFGIASFNTQDFLLLQVSHSKDIVDKSTIMQLLSGEIDINQVTTTQKHNFLDAIKLLPKTPVDNLDNIQNSYIRPDIALIAFELMVTNTLNL
jgi:RNA polymerase sigma-54 factor